MFAGSFREQWKLVSEKIFSDIRISRASWVKACIYAIIIGIAYSEAFSYLFHLWKNDDFSYCILVPFFVLFLIWEKRKILSSIPSVPSWKGFVFISCGIALYMVGELGGEYHTLYISFWFVITGLLWLHLGWRKLKTIWFALVMLFAMFPPPNVICVQITLGLKLLSSKLGIWMLHIFGMSAFREGNIIDLGFSQLQVIDACSGLRYLVPLMVLSLLFSHWFIRYFWKKIVLLASTVPLAILINSFRIAMTGIIHHFFGPEKAMQFFHGFSGGLIFVIALPVMFIIIWMLKKMPPGEEMFITWDSVMADPEVQSGLPVPESEEGILQSRFVVAAVILLGAYAITTNISHLREQAPVRKSFTSFPMTVGQWRGARQVMDQRFIEALKFTDYISVNYYDREGKAINLYIAYYEDQQKGESIHSPESCLPTSGWDFRDLSISKIPGKIPDSPMAVNRVVMEKDGFMEIAYYWFPMRGKVLTRLYQIKLNNFWDALVRQRTDGALVMAITPMYPKESTVEPDTRLRKFVVDIEPVLREYLPQ